MERLTFIGLRSLDAIEIALLKDIAEKEFGKILRDFRESSLIIRIKPYGTEGARKKYSVHARIESPAIVMTARHADWDLARCLHRTFDNIKSEIGHKFKKNVTRRVKPRFS